MEYVKKVVISFYAVCALFAVGAAQATLIQYQIDFDGARDGVPGTGSFFWDESTQLISQLSWDFGGLTGGVDDRQAHWSTLTSVGTKAQFVFEILTLQDVAIADCNSIGGCSTGLSGSQLYGFPADGLLELSVSWPGQQTYRFMENSVSVARGNFSTSVVRVSEPSLLLLVSLGLVIYGVARKSPIPRLLPMSSCAQRTLHSA